MARNQDLAALQRDLITVVNELAKAQERAADAATIVALSREISEVTHRATLVGQLLFTEHTDRLAGALAKVTEGKAELDAAIKEIDRLNAFLRAAAKFLSLVDKVIDTAKLI